MNNTSIYSLDFIIRQQHSLSNEACTLTKTNKLPKGPHTHHNRQTISHITTDHFTHHNRPFHTSQHRQFHTSQQTVLHITTDNFTPHNRQLHTSQQTISHITTDRFTPHNRPFHTSQQTISHLTTDHFTPHNRLFHTSQQTIGPFHTSQHTISVCVPRTWLKSSVDHCRLAMDSSTFISRDWSTIMQNWW